MRLFPIVTALLVCVALFFVVLQRDALLGFARGFGDGGEVSASESEPVAEPAVAADPVAIATTDAEDGREAVHVIALASQAQDVPDAVMARGQSEAARTITIMAEISGRVMSEPLRKGLFVEAGQILCEIDPGSSAATLSEAEARLTEARARVPETEARIAEAQARLQEARINQTAAARLGEGGFASTTRVANADAALRSAEAVLTGATTGLDTTRAGIQAAEAAVERARLDIEKLSIAAPFAGLLETDTAELGALMQPGSPCATVIQLDPMKLVGFLPEAQVDRVSVGGDAAARLASGGAVEGKVTFLSRAADEMTRTFRVEVTVDNADLTIRDGQTVEILIATPPTRAHLIPASAMTLNDEGTLGIRIVEDGIAGFAPVELVRDTPEGVLLGDLPDMVDVIVVGQEYVTDGVPVRTSFETLESLRASREATR
ncbi:MAG: efflux RND transporter periplasmic adaptor subunit [Jannaschia sp.]